MRIYLFISKEKKILQMYLPYIEALNQKFDICQVLADADIVLIFGAWTRKGAQLASKSRKMGIPYIVCPLGDISERNRQNPHLKRMMQTLMYQKSMYKHANLLVASTPMERNYLMKLGWNNHVIIAQIMQIQSRMPHQNIPQSYLDDLHTLLYADNYDEDAINEELRKLKLEDYAAAVFQAMTDKTGLTEGFMPLPARKSRKSKEILKYVK